MTDIWMDVDAALSEVPINVMPLVDDTDFKTIEDGLTYDQAGLDLVWNFVTTAGAFTQTAVTPTDTGGAYDWVSQGNGLYTIEIPASGGASINNDTEGFGWFSGVATGVLPWRGPVIGFRDAGLNNLLIDSAYSATRGLAGTALPAAAADAAGGLPISDAGALDMDAILADTSELQTNQGAWATATGFSTHSAADVKTAIEAAGSHLALILADTGTDGVKISSGTGAGQISLSSGAVSVYALANGIINSNTYDESSAFALAQEDTGATAVARTGADSDTLETLSDEIASVQADTTEILLDTGTTIPGTLANIPAAVLSLSVADVEDAASEYSLCAIVLACLESSISGGTWTIRKTGGTTFATKTVTSSASAEPITGVT